MSETVMSASSTNQRIEMLEQAVAGIKVDVSNVKSSTTNIEAKLDRLIDRRPGLKDIWTPIGVAVAFIALVGTVAASGPLDHMHSIDGHLDHTDTTVEAQRTRTDGLNERLERVENILDDRNQARFMADQGVKVAPSRNKR